MKNKVKKIVEEHIVRTDVRYYCPHCGIILWNGYVFPFPMRLKCPECNKKIVWDELEFFEDKKCYAINREVADLC